MTAVVALLALTAMHALPMASTRSAVVAAEAAVMAGMHDDHVVGLVMAGSAAPAATRSTDGVPPHEHSVLHLCVAVLAVGLSLALATVLRRRPWTSIALSRMAPVRAVLTRDTGPPSLAGLCLLRC